MALPVLLDIFASVILPVATSTLTTQMPLPVRLRRFASYGYSGKGALIAIDCATDRDIGTGSGTPPTSDSTRGGGFLFGRGFLAGAVAGGDSSGETACSTGCGDGAPFDAIVGGTEAASLFFSGEGTTSGGNSSAAGGWSGTGAVFCFGTVAGLCEFDSGFFFFDF